MPLLHPDSLILGVGSRSGSSAQHAAASALVVYIENKPPVTAGLIGIAVKGT